MTTTLSEMRIGNPSSNLAASGTVRYYSSIDFTGLDGVKYKGGRLDSKNFFLTNTWSVSNGDLIVPSIADFPTTSDGQPSSAKITAGLYSGNTRIGILFENYQIPANPSGPLTMLYLETLKHLPTRVQSPDTLTRTDFGIMLEQAVNTALGTLNDASTTIKGRTKLSVAPASASSPIAVGNNDRRIPPSGAFYYASHYDTFADALVSMGNSNVRLIVSEPMTTGNGTVPSTVQLEFVGNGTLTITTGATLIIRGALIAPPKQIFAGAGTVSFAASAKVKEWYLEWWGGAANGSSDNLTAANALLAAWDTVDGGTIRFLSGTYNFSASPNWLKSGIAIAGEGGTFIKHTGSSGHAFTMDSGAPGVTWIHRVRVENFTIIGSYSTLTGTATAAVGTNQVVGTGTLFTTEVAIGDGISFESGMNTETRVVTAIADNTHLTVSANWAANQTGAIEVGKTQNGLHLVGVRNGTFRNISVKDVVNAGVYTQNLVTNTFEDFVCTSEEPTMSAGWVIRPQYGILLDADSTTATFIEPVIEAIQAIGIWTKNGAYGNTFINGTSEGNKGKGAVIASTLNTFINTDFEANGGNDIEVASSRNAFHNIYSDGTIVISAGQSNRFVGGTLQNVTIDAIVDFTLIDGAVINGTFTDSNPATTLLLPRVVTLDGGLHYETRIGNVLPRTGVLTSGATVATNVRDASYFYLAVFDNFTLSNPTNPTNGQTITWHITQTGAFTMGFGAKFRVPPGRNFPSLPAASSSIIITASYSASDDIWLITNAPPKSGQDTFAGAGTKAVTFVINEPNTAYRVGLSASVNEAFWITSKATTGFTLNSSNAASTAVVDWVLTR